MIQRDTISDTVLSPKDSPKDEWYCFPVLFPELL